jgi:hypothetical protein
MSATTSRAGALPPTAAAPKPPTESPVGGRPAPLPAAARPAETTPGAMRGPTSAHVSADVPADAAPQAARPGATTARAPLAATTSATSALPQSVPPLAARQGPMTSAADLGDTSDAPLSGAVAPRSAATAGHGSDEATPVARPRPRTPPPAPPAPARRAETSASKTHVALVHPPVHAPVHALDIASTSQQVAAAAIDALGIAAVVTVALRATMAAVDIRPTLQGVTDVVHGDWVRLVPVVAGAALAVLAFEALSVVLCGSPGQRLVGLQLVDRKGAHPSRGRLAVRAVVASVGVAAFLAGPAFALFLDRLRRGPGDVVVGTVAVRR